MLDIVIYSNDSFFLAEYTKLLTSHLGLFAEDVCRFRKSGIFQTSLFDDFGPPPDLCIVDIRDEPERDLEFAARLRRNAATEIMLVSNTTQYAMDAYNIDALSYMLDPPDIERSARIILRRFSQWFKPQEAKFSFRTAEGTQLLAAERIVYVEYSDHRMLVHTDLGKRIDTTTMRCSFGDAAAQLLADPRFVRTHASFLVNIMHIGQFGKYVLTTDTGVTVPVSHGRQPDVRRRFTEFFSAPV